MNKQKIMAAAAGAIVAVTSLAGASLAYFTDTKTAANVFTMGNVRIALDETDVQNPNGDRVTANTYAVYPGAVVTKDPVVHNTGANGAYVRATVNVSDWVHMVSRYFPAFDAEFPSADYDAALELLVDEETLAARRKAWKAPAQELSGYAKRYAQHVTSGSKGAVFDDML